MSVISHTGRHEDDIVDEANRNYGEVGLDSILDHAQGIIAEQPTMFGVVNAAVVESLVTLIREIGREHPEVLDIDNAEIPLFRS